MTYGQIAMEAGNHRGARQVSRILHSTSKKYNLPWHRVINSKGKISLEGTKKELQQGLLEEEGIEFGVGDTVDLSKYMYIKEF